MISHGCFDLDLIDLHLQSGVERSVTNCCPKLGVEFHGLGVSTLRRSEISESFQDSFDVLVFFRKLSGGDVLLLEGNKLT